VEGRKRKGERKRERHNITTHGVKEREEGWAGSGVSEGRKGAGGGEGG
jgi:hypothetical protein